MKIPNDEMGDFIEYVNEEGEGGGGIIGRIG